MNIMKNNVLWVRLRFTLIMLLILLAIFIPYRLQATVQLYSHIIFDKDQFFGFIVRVELSYFESIDIVVS